VKVSGRTRIDIGSYQRSAGLGLENDLDMRRIRRPKLFACLLGESKTGGKCQEIKHNKSKSKKLKQKFSLVPQCRSLFRRPRRERSRRGKSPGRWRRRAAGPAPSPPAALRTKRSQQFKDEIKRFREIQRERERDSKRERREQGE
jgi:hypothetical protein